MAADLEAQRRAAAQARDKFKKNSPEWKNANKKVEAIRKQIQDGKKGGTTTTPGQDTEAPTPEEKAKTKEEIASDMGYWEGQANDFLGKYSDPAAFAKLPTDVNDQMLNSIDKLEGRTNKSPEEEQSLAMLKDTYNKMLTRDPGVQDSLNALKAANDKANVRDPEVQRSLDMLEEMTKGMDSKVLQAQREEAQLAQDSDYATQAQALRRQAAVSGARGMQQAAMQAQLDKARQDAGRSFERQLLTDNLNFTNTARNNFFGAVNTTQQRESDARINAANNMYKGNEETVARENTDRILSSKNFADTAGNINTRLDNAANTFNQAAGARQAYQTGAAQYNAGQASANQALRMGTVLGMQGTGLGLQGNAEAAASQRALIDLLAKQREDEMAMSKRYLDIQEKAYNKM